MYKWLNFGRKVLLHALCRYVDANIKTPSVDNIAFYKEAIATKYSFVPDAWEIFDPRTMYR